LRFLLRHAPPQLRLVVATRADPPLALHRLRVAGQLSEIREAELAFTLEETRRLLEDHGVVLSAGELETLPRRPGGWAAGRRLAALSVRAHPRPERFVADLAGDDRAIAGYLVEEVLAAQPPELRSFLLRTSVAARLVGDLADALTDGDDGARVLARLEREHVFTSAAGPTRAWYRYHPLFAELLRAELRYEHAAEVPGLHRRAASWHAGAGQPVAPIRPGARPPGAPHPPRPGRRGRRPGGRPADHRLGAAAGRGPGGRARRAGLAAARGAGPGAPGAGRRGRPPPAR